MIPASQVPPSRGRMSTASYTTSSSTSRPSRQSTSTARSSHLSDTESEAPSTAGTERRPQSRRTNFVAVLNDDKKTFSLVPQRPKDSHSEQAQDPRRSESALSEYGGGPSIRSSHSPSFSSTPRVSQASLHEGLSSYASSQYDRPSSSLAGTIPDRSITPGTPTSAVPSSPGLTVTAGDFVPDSSPTSWNVRMVGGLRRVPNLPDSEKHLAHTHTSSSDTLTPLPAVTDSAPPVHEDNPVNTVNSQLIGEGPPASIHSSPPQSSGSDTTNYRVYRDISEATLDPAPRATREEQETPATEASIADPFLRQQPSFAPSFATAQTDNSNYQVYGHTDDEGSDDDHSGSPTAGPSARALRLRHIPQLEPQSSFASLQSDVSDASDSTNIRTYGPRSPGLEPVPEFSALQSTRELRPVPSFLSTVSTIPEGDNYIVYGRHSPAALSSIDSITPSSPTGSYAPLIRPQTAQSLNVREEEEEEAAGTSGIADPNYVVHSDPTPNPSGDASPATSESGGTTSDQQDPPESALVSPLRPRRSEEGFGYFRARSRSRSGSLNKDELRAKKSLRSAKSSISSIITEEAAESFFAGQAYLDGPVGDYETSGSTVAGPSERQRQLDEQRERERQRKESFTWEGEEAAQGPMALPATPHQWSSQLSTVISESEPDDSSATHSSLRSVSLPGSPGGQGSGSHVRRHSRGWSTHSRQMLSISSSLVAEMEASSRSRSDSQPSQRGSSERPSPSQRYQGQVRDHDEDGDGLADLQKVTPRPSRTRLSEMFHSGSSERSLHSSASTQSFHNGIPTWAKVYYGSGERRFLRSHSISSISDTSYRPESMLQHSNSPTSDQFPNHLRNARRRAQEGHPGQQRSATGSMEISPGSAGDHVYDIGFRRSIRRMTSSVWSPHLRRDLRAHNRYTMWDTPSVAWSAESGMFGRRNFQVVLFVSGFIFPFAWMIGALLPLPKPSPLAMVQRDSSHNDLGVRTNSNEFERHIESVDELRYENAKWWRMLNRCMAVVGLLILGAIAGLAVAAVKQGWGRT